MPNSKCNFQNEITRQSVKRKAEEDPNVRPGKIICKEIKGHEGYYNMDNFAALRMAIYRKKAEERPGPLPTSFEQTLEYMKALGVYDDDHQLIVDDDNDIGMIYNSRVLASMNNINHVYADGTFKCAPQFVTQVYTFCVLDNGYYIPSIFFLLHDKTAKTYKALLDMLFTHFQEKINLQSITIDFEQGMISVLKNHFQNINVHCCRFHLGQSWNRQIGKHGLNFAFYNQTQPLGLWLKSLFNLPGISSAHVSKFYKQHKENFDVNTLESTTRVLFTNFLAYLDKYYLGENPVFHPAIWAGLTFKKDIRYTNNGCEAFHSVLSRRLNPHPNIFEFLEAISEINTENILKLQSGKELPKNQFDDKDAEHGDLLEGNIDIACYLKIVSNDKDKMKLPLAYGPIFQSPISIFHFTYVPKRVKK